MSISQLVLQSQTSDFSSIVQNGVVVIPLPENVFDQFDLNEFLCGQKEFKVSNPDTLFVMGAFGALGNPSAQHHPTLRKLRTAVYKHMAPLFQSVFQGKYLELIPDRFSIRHQDQPVSAESWHRDASATIEACEHIFGGYVNLDLTQTQYFSCVPGTHLDDHTSAGFAKISKEDGKLYNARRTQFAVPPRHIILFNENTVHEIARKKIKEAKSYRQYFKWRISNTCVSTLGEATLNRAIDDQGTFPLHAIGKTPNPPMYGQMHVIHWGDRVATFSENIKEEFLAPPNKKGQVFVKRFMPSLREAGLELFPAYTQEERDMLFPQLL
jgi:hypothetical protein